MTYLKLSDDILAIDIGGNIGTFTLFAAKSGKKVLTIEPSIENAMRIHKSVKEQNLVNQITLIKNIVSNKRGEIYGLEQLTSNFGNKIVNLNPKLSLESVEAIILDDIINYLPKNDLNKKFTKAIIKIDIEGTKNYFI